MKNLILLLILAPTFIYAFSPSPRFPEDDFKYSCHAELSEQVKGDYVTAFMDFSFDKASMFEKNYLEKTFSQADWTLTEYHQENGKSLPKNADGFLTIDFGYTTNPKSEDRIFLFGSIHSGKKAYAKSKTSASYSKNEDLKLNVNVQTPDDSTSVTLNVDCVRILK